MINAFLYSLIYLGQFLITNFNLYSLVINSSNIR